MKKRRTSTSPFKYFLVLTVCSFTLATQAAPFLDGDLSKGFVISDVSVEGNRLVSEQQILSVIQSQVGKIYDKQNIVHDLEAIDALGYFIRESIQATPEITDEGVLIKIRIEENSPITGVHILGNNLISTEELTLITDELIAKPENVLKTSEILDRIEIVYKEKGYLLARIAGVDLDPDGTLTININEGIIDEIVFKGNEKSTEKLLRRLTPNSMAGEAYNEVLVVQDLRSLNDTGYYEGINRTVEPSKEDPNKYNLVIEVQEKKATSFGFGGGVNNLSGGFVNLGFNKNNVRGNGEKFTLNTQLGTGLIGSTLDDDQFIAKEKTVNLEARYTIPNLFDTNTQLSTFANANTFSSYQVDLARERSYRLGTTLSRALGMNFHVNLDLIGENVDVDDVSGTDSATQFLTMQLVSNEGLGMAAASKEASELREEQLEDGKYLYLNPSISYDTRDSTTDTMSGWNNQATFGQALGIGADSYTKLGIDIRRYIPIGEKTTLAFNVRGATSLLGDIPSFSQFRAGGYYGVRGYRPFSELGIGSRSLLASAELRTNWIEKIPFIKNTPIADNLKLVFFGDFGYVGGNSRLNSLYGRLDTAASAGIGFRANLPLLGPIRVDYGLPLLAPLVTDSRSLLGRFNFGFSDRF